MVRNTFRAAPSAAPRGAVAGGGRCQKQRGRAGRRRRVWSLASTAKRAAARTQRSCKKLHSLCKIKKMVPTMYKQGERLDRTHRSAQQVVGAPLSTSHQSTGAHKDEKAFSKLVQYCTHNPKGGLAPAWLADKYICNVPAR